VVLSFPLVVLSFHLVVLSFHLVVLSFPLVVLSFHLVVLSFPLVVLSFHSLLLSFHLKGDLKGWSMVLIIALRSWDKSVLRGHSLSGAFVSLSCDFVFLCVTHLIRDACARWCTCH
jgi:type IV secretory pathway TraG/TraD family ATPase VirD4